MKRTTWLVLLLLLLGIGGSEAYAQKVAFVEDFETATLPDGWSRTGTVWKIYDGEALFSTVLLSATDTLITPLLDVSDLDERSTVLLRMKQVVTNNVVDWLSVLYRVETGADWSPLARYETPRGGTYSELAITLPADVTDKVQLAFAGSNNSAGGIYIDYVKVQNAAVCGTPVSNLSVDAEFLTSTGAVVSWAAATTANFKGYNIKVSSVALTDMETEADIANEVSYRSTDYILGTLEGELVGPELEPNKTYWFYIQSDCGDGDVSEWTSLSFETPCDAVTGIEEGFEGNKIPDCWKVFNLKADDTPHTSASYCPKTASTIRHTGQYALFFNNSTTYARSYVFTPELEDLGNKQLTFWAASAATSNTPARVINVALATTQAVAAIDKNTVHTFTLPEYNKNWYELTVSFKGYTGNAKYIVIYTDNALAANAIYVDDVVVEPATDCPKPFFPQTGTVTANSAEISWTEGGTETAWNLLVSKTAVTDFENLDVENVVFTGQVESNPYVVTGLEPSSSYYYYVQNVCGGNAWTACTAPFKTTKAMILPYTEHFDSWNNIADAQYVQPQSDFVLGCRSTGDYSIFVTSGTNTGKAGSSTSNTSVSPILSSTRNHDETDSPNQNGALYLKSGTTSVRPFIMFPGCLDENGNLREARDLMVTFYVFSTTANKIVEVGVSDVYSNNIPQGQMLASGGKYQKVGEYTIKSASTWEKVEMPLGAYEGNGRFITIMTGLVQSNSVYIDDVTISEAPDCFKVTALTAKTLSPSEVKFTWREQGKARQWDVNCSSVQLDDPSVPGDLLDGNLISTTTTEYVCQGLAPATQVYCYVRPHDCDVEWQETTGRSKYTIADLPYANDFSSEKYTKSGAFTSVASGLALPYDIVVGSFSTAVNKAPFTPYIANTAWANAPADVANNYLAFKVSTSSNTGAYAILPEYTGATAIKDLVLTFYGYYLSSLSVVSSTTTSCKKGELKIGVADTDAPASLNDITYVATVRCSTASIPERFVVPMSNYTGTGKYIVFYTDATEGNNFALDNLQISVSSDLQHVSNIVVSETTINSAKVTWTENGHASQWNVRYFAGGASDPEAEGGVTVNVNTTPECVLENLVDGETYAVYIRPVAGDGSVGEWSLATIFFTECAVKTIADGVWTDDFNAYEPLWKGMTLPPCYDAPYGAVSETAVGWPVTVCNTSNAWNNSSANGPSDHTYPSDVNKRALLFKGGSSTANPAYQYLILPEFTEDIRTLQLRFYAASTKPRVDLGEGGWLEIGVIKDDDITTFTEIYEWNSTKTKEWEEVTVAFDSYMGTGNRIAIRNDRISWAAKGYPTAKATYTWLDDISVTKIPECRRLTTVSVNNIDSVSALVSWRKAADETLWNIKLHTSLLNDPDTDEAWRVVEGVENTQYALTDLTAVTDYYVYVQAVDPVKDCASEWSLPVHFKTTWTAQPLPFTLPLTTAMKNMVPDMCFGHGETPAAAAGVSVQTTYAYVNGKTGTPVVQMCQSTLGKDNYLVLPLVQTESVKDLLLTFELASHYTDVISFFEVGVTVDPYNISTYTVVAKDSIDGSVYSCKNPGTWTTRMYDFSAYVGDDYGRQGKYLTLRLLSSKKINGGAETSSRLSFKDITITEKVSCTQPTNLKVEKIGTDSVLFSWTDLIKNATFDVRLFGQRPVASNAAEGITDADIDRIPYLMEMEVKDTLSAVFKGLTPNTPYYAAVRMKCEDNETTSWSNIEVFRTHALVPQPLPYIEGFENIYPESTTSAVYGLLPENWTMISGGTEKDYSGVTNGYQYEGLAKLVVYKDNMVLTPLLDVESLQETFISFYAYSYQSSFNDFNIGVYAVADDYAGEGDATLIQTVNVPYVGTDALGDPANLAPAYLDLSSYTGSYKRIGLKMLDAHMRIDYVTIGTNKSLYQVQELKEVVTADTWSVVKFIELNSSQTSWVAEFGPRGFKHGDGTEVILTSTTDTIKGLTPNMSYDIYVRTNADGAEWSDVLRIKTTTPIVVIPPYEDYFEKVSEEWQFLQYSNQKKYLWMYRTIQVDEPATYKVLLDLDAAPALHDLTAALVPVSYTIYNHNCLTSPLHPYAHNIGIGKFNSENMENGCVALANQVSQDTTLTVKATITKPGLYRLMVLYHTTSTGTVPVEKPAPLNSIVFEKYACLTPTDAKLTALCDTAASFAWQGGTDNTYEVMIAVQGMSNPFALPEDAPERYDYAVLGNQTNWTTQRLLKPQTDYSFYVRSICEDAETMGVAEVPFTTTCGKIVLPLREDFDEEPTCWRYDRTENYIDTYWNHQLTFKDSQQSYNVMVVKKDGLLVLPAFDNALNTLRVRFSVGFGATSSISSSVAEFIVGAMDNVFDESTFEELASYVVPCKTSGSRHIWVEANLRLNQYAGTGKVLALKAGSKEAVFIDWLEVSVLPEFLEPTGVKITDITSTEALVNWVPGDETSWKIRLNGETEIMVDEYPYLLTELNPGEDYVVEVAAIYPNGVSEYTDPVSFATMCTTLGTPFTEDFSGVVAENLPLDVRCWDVKYSSGTIDDVVSGTAALTPVPSNTTTPQAYAWCTPNSAANGLYVYSGENYSANRWLIMPELSIPEKGVLSFDVYINPTNTTLHALSGVFALAISEDDGATWKKELVFANKLLGEKEWKTMHVGLSHYAGQNIRMAFYHGVSSSTAVQLRLDNVHVNCVDTLHAKDTACTGYAYENAPFVYTAEEITAMEGLTVMLQKFVPMTDDCDKSMNLQLYVDTIHKDTILATVCHDKFVYEGQEYAEGTYLLPYQTENGCDGWRYIFVTKDPNCLGTSLDNLNVADLKVRPNPVANGGVYSIERTFTEAEKKELTVRLYDATGRLVEMVTPTTYPLVLQAPDKAGVYMIRLVTGTGEVLTEKLVVK